MKIVYLSPSSIPSRAANSIHVMKMCEALALNGHEVTLFAQYGDHSFQSDFEIYGVKNNFKIIKNNTKYFGRFSSIFHGLISAFKCIFIRPDLIYSRHTYSLFFASFLNIKMIHEDHHLPPLIHQVLLKKIIIKSQTKVVLISQSLKEDYLNLFDSLDDENCLVAHDGASVFNFDKKYNNCNLKRLNNNNINIGYIGQLYPGKGLEVILPVAALLPNCNFHIIGGMDSDISYWKNKITSENITFYGFVSPSEVSCYLSKIDIMLAPYQEDCNAGGKYNISTWMSPLKIFEYMAAEKIIICSDLPVLQEVLDHEYNAILVKSDHIEGWRDAIINLINSKELQNYISKNARKDLESRYTWEIRAKNILSAF